MITCPYCGGEAELVPSTEIYGDKANGWPPRYFCRPCFAHVGTHKGTNPPKPLGTLANYQVRQLRKKCHDVIDPFWKRQNKGLRNKNKRYRREIVYRVLKRVMEMTDAEAHVGMWQVEECEDFLVLAGKFKRGMREEL